MKKNNIDKDEFYIKVRECAKTNSYAVKTAAKYYGVDTPRWYGELEKLYSDVDDILYKLSKKYKLGIIANQQIGTQERINNWGIGKYFDIVIASAEAGFSKPDLRILIWLLNKQNARQMKQL